MTLIHRFGRHPFLMALALALGFIGEGASEVWSSNALGRPISINEPVVFVLNALLFAVPLIALALQSRQHVVPWVAGFGLSGWLTWWWLQKGIAYQRNPDGSGVDMGGAVISLLAPFAISEACLWLNRRLGRGQANDS